MDTVTLLKKYVSEFYKRFLCVYIRFFVSFSDYLKRNSKLQ